MNGEIKLMKSQAGKYVVSNSGFREHGRYGVVEVAEDQSVRKLDANGNLKQYLSDDGWNPDATVWKFEGSYLVRINDPKDRINMDEWRERE